MSQGWITTYISPRICAPSISINIGTINKNIENIDLWEIVCFYDHIRDLLNLIFLDGGVEASVTSNVHTYTRYRSGHIRPSLHKNGVKKLHYWWFDRGPWVFVLDSWLWTNMLVFCQFCYWDLYHYSSRIPTTREIKKTKSMTHCGTL